MVDCQGVCTALEARTPQNSSLLWKLCSIIREVTEDYNITLDIVWISSHCGINGNEEADALAREGLNLPLSDQTAVPVDFADARAAIRSQTEMKRVEVPPELPENMKERWTSRKASVLLNQLYTGCCAIFQPLRQILQLGSGQCRHCTSEDTVDHFFKCPGRTSRRRAHFVERQGWRSRILEKPFQVLGYLLGEEDPNNNN